MNNMKCKRCNNNFVPVNSWQKFCCKKCEEHTNHYISCADLCKCGNRKIKSSKRCQSCYMKEKVKSNINNRHERFNSMVFKTTSCWLWQGAKNKSGHGVTRMFPPDTIASRVSWKLNVGCIPKGKLVLHKCDVPPCVNPDHLYIGTHTDNILDAYNRGQRKPRGRGKNARKISKSRSSSSK